MVLYVAERFNRGCSYDIEVSFNQSDCVNAVDYDYNYHLTPREQKNTGYIVSGYKIPDCIPFSNDAGYIYRLFTEWCFDEYGYIIDPVSSVELYGGNIWQ